MKQTPEQLHNELMNKLKEFTDDIGYHLPPDKIPDTTKSVFQKKKEITSPTCSGRWPHRATKSLHQTFSSWGQTVTGLLSVFTTPLKSSEKMARS